LKKFHIYLLWVFFLYSCANQVPLEGGPKDEAAPVLQKAVPDTFALNFRGRRITLSFDEFVVVRNPSREVIVSPPVDELPVVQVTGKSVEVIFQDSLKSNTTYTIQFGESIADNNEGNVLQNYSYTFSTGPFLDSLEAYAVVLDAFTLKPVENVKWMLYSEMGDSTPYKEKPFYIGYSTPDGKAAIRYMRKGTFRQFALTESNNNSRYDAADEWIGFLDSTVIPGDSAVHRVLMFREKSKKNRLRFAKPVERGMIAFKFMNDASDVKIRPITDSLPPAEGHMEFMSETFDSLIYWHPRILKDTLFFELQFPEMPLDTVRVIYRKPRGSSSSGGKGKTGGTTGITAPTTTKFQFTTNLTSRFDFYKPIEIEFNHPVPALDSACITLLQSGKPVVYSWQFTDSVQRKIQIDLPFRQGTEYVFRMKDSCFTDLWGNYNDSLVVPFKTSQQKDYTTLTLRASGVQGDGVQLIFQLMDKEDKILQEKNIQQQDGLYTVTFGYLLPGSYRVKLIYDSNGNGKWDTGNYMLRRQPEKVSFFPRNIDMKPGFDLDFDWDVNAEPEKPAEENKKEGGKFNK